MDLTLLERGPIPVWLNDLDRDLTCLWSAALRHTDALCERIQSTSVTVETFYQVQSRILKDVKRSLMDRAMDKLIAHKLSYSNMGEMAATPVGGKNQTGDWKFDVRWNPDSICQAIRRVAAMFDSVRLTSQSVFKMLPCIPASALVYLDPPYVTAGGKCYKHSFSDEDHVQLAMALRKVKWNWFMTYDDHPLIRHLYAGQYKEIDLRYQMSSAYRKNQALKTTTELLITN